MGRRQRDASHRSRGNGDVRTVVFVVLFSWFRLFFVYKRFLVLNSWFEERSFHLFYHSKGRRRRRRSIEIWQTTETPPPPSLGLLAQQRPLCSQAWELPTEQPSQA